MTKVHDVCATHDNTNAAIPDFEVEIKFSVFVQALHAVFESSS